MAERENQEENWALWEQYNPRTGNWLSDTKDILLRFFQDFFYQMDAGQQPSLFHFAPLAVSDDPATAYQTDELTTELIITDAGSLNTDSVEKRPALVISRGPFAYGNTSLDHLLGIDADTAKEHHTDLLSGSFVLNCISRNGVEAERLAVIVARAIRSYRSVLQKAGFFHIGSLIQVGSESPPGALLTGDADEDYVNVPVSIAVYYQDSWTIQPNAEVLGKIRLIAYAVLRDFQGDLLSPDALDEDGNPVDSSEGVLVAEWVVP